MREKDTNRIKKVLAWLRDVGLDISAFAESIGADYNTVYRWIHDGAAPRKISRRIIRDRWPDCPLVK